MNKLHLEVFFCWGGFLGGLGWIFFVVVFFNMTFSMQCTRLEMGQNFNPNVKLTTFTY